MAENTLHTCIHTCECNEDSTTTPTIESSPPTHQTNTQQNLVFINVAAQLPMKLTLARPKFMQVNLSLEYFT